MIKLAKIQPNPDNPRTITDAKFKTLVASIKDFPKMMRLNPLTLENKETMLILGGNMRYRALLEAGYKEIPDNWVQYADDLTEDEKRKFIIEDNIMMGDWDWDMLANQWEQPLLVQLGLDYPSFMGTDVPRPDFNDTAMDKGTPANAKDGNWFYIEFYGQDDTFGELMAALEAVDAMASKHQLKTEVFLEAMQLWIKAKQGE